MKTQPNEKATELTKRELFAAIAMAGMAAGKYAGNNVKDDVETAINMADELINQLNK